MRAFAHPTKTRLLLYTQRRRSWHIGGYIAVHIYLRCWGITGLLLLSLSISAYDPGCVKSRTGQKYVESISLLPSREGGYGTVRLLNRRNREGSSKRKLNFRLFTQPGPGTGVPPGLLSDSHPSVSGRRAGISEPSNNPLPRAL